MVLVLVLVLGLGMTSALDWTDGNPPSVVREELSELRPGMVVDIVSDASLLTGTVQITVTVVHVHDPVWETSC
jgi:hypothetical protein